MPVWLLALMGFFETHGRTLIVAMILRHMANSGKALDCSSTRIVCNPQTRRTIDMSLAYLCVSLARELMSQANRAPLRTREKWQSAPRPPLWPTSWRPVSASAVNSGVGTFVGLTGAELTVACRKNMVTTQATVEVFLHIN